MCFHNSMSAKAIKLAARYGRKSDIVEIYQDMLNEQYHVNASGTMLSTSPNILLSQPRMKYKFSTGG